MPYSITAAVATAALPPAAGAEMVAARRSRDFMIIARTDARHVTGMDDAIARANRYREAGACAIFPEGLQSEEEFAAFAEGSTASMRPPACSS